MRTFQSQLREILSRRNLSQVALARAMGVGESRVSHIMVDGTNVSPGTIDSVARIFGISPFEFDWYVRIKLPELSAHSDTLIALGREVGLREKPPAKGKKHQNRR